jgi:hypothetical protein
MPDSYVSISEIAADAWMGERLRACASQQEHLGNPPADPIQWVTDNRYVWASSPTWGEKWDYAKATHEGDLSYQPGRDAAVITDADILATVQALTAPPPPPPEIQPLPTEEKG